MFKILMLQRYYHLSYEQITIQRFRSGSAPCQQEAAEVVSKESEWLYILLCAMLCRDGTTHRPFDGQQAYRLAVSRIKGKDQQRNILSRQACAYRSILTNDRDLSNEEVAAFYNERGKAEQAFDIMNNDFG